MTERKRLLWEIVGTLVLVTVFSAALWITIKLKDRALAEAVASGEVARDEAAARGILQVFAAGIRPEVMAGAKESVRASMLEILQLEGVTFVHVVLPTGEVVASSDLKLENTGKAEFRGALEAARKSGKIEIVKAHEGSPVLDAAGPIAGSPDPVAYVSIGYDTRSGD